MSDEIDPRFITDDQHFQMEAIERAREEVRHHVREARVHLREADRAAHRLGRASLLDVEFAETNNGEIVYVNARAQIDVGLAAIDGAIPREGA